MSFKKKPSVRIKTARVETVPFKILYLVRHSFYENPKNILAGRLPLALSKQGIKHTEKLRRYFEHCQIETLYSSAVKRCEQTSEIISNNSIPIKYDKRLLESISAYQGFSYEHGKIHWDDFHKYQDTLGGETYQDIYARVSSFLDEILQQKQKRLIICSHGDVLYLMYVWCMGGTLPNSDWYDLEAYLGESEFQRKGTVRKIMLDKKGVCVDQYIVSKKELEQVSSRLSRFQSSLV